MNSQGAGSVMTQGASALFAETIQRHGRLVEEVALGWWDGHCCFLAVEPLCTGTEGWGGGVLCVI